MLGEIRNQGTRPTCMAFAASDAHSVLRRPYEALSPEHLYYQAVQRTPGADPANGVSLGTVLEALELDGQCLEKGWPYLQTAPADLATWAPPQSAAPLYKCYGNVLQSALDEIVAAVDKDYPVVVTMLLGERFYAPIAGTIEPGAGDNDTDYHAVLAVGHGRVGQKKYVLVRNSWGDAWGIDGHAWIARDYLQPRLYKLARMEKVI